MFVNLHTLSFTQMCFKNVMLMFDSTKKHYKSLAFLYYFVQGLRYEATIHISTSLISRWKRRHDVKFNVMSGEAINVNEGNVLDWKHYLHTILNKCKPMDIYNVRESSLSWGILPDWTLAFKLENAPGGIILKNI